MASGRMIGKKIGCSKQVHDLSSDTCRLAYTWTIPHLDKEGRIHGDASILKSLIFPRRIDVTPEMMQDFITEWAINGLVQMYEVQGDIYLFFPSFKKNQPGLRPEKEPDSILPAPDEGRQIDAILPPKVRRNGGKRTVQGNGREVKGSKGKIEDAAKAADADASIAETDKVLYHRVEAVFLAKNDDRFTDYPKEGSAIKGLLKKAKARAPDDPDSLLHAMLEAFWKLRCGDDKFWKGQPFLPSTLNSSAIWDRVLEMMRNKERMTDPVAMRVAKGEMT